MLLQAAKAGHLSVLMWSQQVQPSCTIDLQACLEAAKVQAPGCHCLAAAGIPCCDDYVVGRPFEAALAAFFVAQARL